MSGRRWQKNSSTPETEEYCQPLRDNAHHMLDEKPRVVLIMGEHVGQLDSAMCTLKSRLHPFCYAPHLFHTAVQASQQGRQPGRRSCTGCCIQRRQHMAPASGGRHFVFFVLRTQCVTRHSTAHKRP